MSLVTDQFKTSISGAFDQLHETFKRDIYVFVEQFPTVPVSSSYNPLYGFDTAQPQLAPQKELVKHTVEARIYYPDRGLEKAQADVLRIPESALRVRVKVNAAGYELIKKASKIEVDGSLYTQGGDATVEGPFSASYYSVYLDRIS